jgi:hypothetical protein
MESTLLVPAPLDFQPSGSWTLVTSPWGQHEGAWQVRSENPSFPPAGSMLTCKQALAALGYICKGSSDCDEIKM